MRTAIVLLLLTALIQGPAWATSVGLFADPAGTSLTFHDTGSELLSIYVVVINTPGAAAVGFSAPLPDCFLGASYLTDTFVYPITLGNSQTGIGIGFGTCITGPIHVLTIHVLTAGLTERCCPYPVIPDPPYIPEDTTIVTPADSLPPIPVLRSSSHSCLFMFFSS